MGITKTEREKAWLEGLKNLFATADFAHRKNRLPKSHEPLTSDAADGDSFIAWVMHYRREQRDSLNDLEIARETMRLQSLAGTGAQRRKA